MSEAIEGKVVLITGGGTGLGAETARHLASKGAIVAIAARRRNKLDEVVAQITGAGGRASAYLLDVADKKQFKGVVDVVIADFGRLDVLINNAGLMPIRPMAEVNTDEWDAMINVNLRGTLRHRCRTVAIFLNQGSGDLKFTTTATSRSNVMELYKAAIPASSVARAIVFAIEQPADVDINEIVVRPTAEEF